MESNHLSNLYFRWKENPSEYQQEVFTTLDKIIFTVFRSKSTLPIRKDIEDYDDLVQDCRLFAFKCFNKIQHPATNKRIYNYLKISLKLYLCDKSRALAKYMDRETIDDIPDIEDTIQPLSLQFTTALNADVANFLAAGYSKKHIRNALNLSYKTLMKCIEEIKETLNETYNYTRTY